MTKEEILAKHIPHGCINLKPGQEKPAIYAAMQEYATQEKQTPSCDHKNASFYHHGGILKCPDCGLMFEDGKQEKQGWVKTSERLPEEVGVCIVFRDEKVELRWFNGEQFRSRNEWDLPCNLTDTISHWMPLPQKPEV